MLRAVVRMPWCSRAACCAPGTRSRHSHLALGTRALGTSVVVLFSSPRHRRHVVHRSSRRGARFGAADLGRLVAALVRSADPLGRREPLEDELDGRRAQRRGRAIVDAQRTACVEQAAALVTRATAAPSTPSVSSIGSVPPRVEPVDDAARRPGRPAIARNTLATADRISSRAMTSAPRSSPSYSSSNLPVIDGSAA